MSEETPRRTSTMLGAWTAIGIAIGLVLGLAIGLALDRRAEAR